MPYEIAVPIHDAAPRSYAAMARFASTAEEEATAAGVPQRVLELVKLRASLLNGCSYCIDLHSRDARALGVPDAVVDAVGSWEASPAFDAGERAALRLTDAATRQSAQAGIDPAAIREAVDRWGAERAAHLALAAAAINAWNVIGVASGLVPAGA